MTVGYFSFLNIIVIIIVESPNTWRLLEISFLLETIFLFWLSLTWLGSAQLCSDCAWLLTQVQIAIIQSYTIQSWALNWQLPVLILLGHVSSHILMVLLLLAC